MERINWIAPIGKLPQDKSLREKIEALPDASSIKDVMEILLATGQEIKIEKITILNEEEYSQQLDV
ncbi:MAG: hypothetical protein HY929_05165 [Euryarchaeota archaeon]|nr:hypothetical protein [Euryarchaeota archaeon]